jgi:Rieske Fe-S protein
MRKSSVGLKKYGKNTSSIDDRARYTISRRRFLGGSALVVLPVLYGGCGGMPGVMVVDLPPVMSNQIAIRLGDFSELMKTGGSIVGMASGYPNPIAIAQVSAGMFVAVDAICTHMRCTVAYSALNVEFECPCHGSTYDATGTVGAVLGGPAPLPLTAFTASSDGTTLTIMLH